VRGWRRLAATLTVLVVALTAAASAEEAADTLRPPEAFAAWMETGAACPQ